eukprot:3070652-Prymnesium_polylepis.1
MVRAWGGAGARGAARGQGQHRRVRLGWPPDPCQRRRLAARRAVAPRVRAAAAPRRQGDGARSRGPDCAEARAAGAQRAHGRVPRRACRLGAPAGAAGARAAAGRRRRRRRRRQGWTEGEGDQ